MFHFISQVFTVVIAQPIFNLLILIIAFLPGHNFGVAIILFTVLVRIAMYPLLKKQLHHAMAMKKLQPDMKRIKKEAAGNKQLESQMMMALYKEKEINPFGSIGIILAQVPILIALYLGITKVVKDPTTLVSFSYSWLHNLPFLKDVAANINNFDESLAGLINLTKPAIDHGVVYWPALILVILSVVMQYIQSKQLMMTDKNARGLKQILKDSSKGKQVDQSEVQAATSKFTLFFIPIILFMVSIGLPSALSLYWFTGALIAFIQQSRILKKDVIEMEATVDKLPVDAEIIESSKKDYKKPKANSKKSKKTKKRR